MILAVIKSPLSLLLDFDCEALPDLQRIGLGRDFFLSAPHNIIGFVLFRIRSRRPEGVRDRSLFFFQIMKRSFHDAGMLG